MIKQTYKILIPDLPKLVHIKKYLKQIDSTHIYSNFGPLNIKFINRIETLWGDRVNILTASSCTAALVGAILTQKNRSSNKKNICILPSYTFVGTISAIISCGYRPVLLDINVDTWDLEVPEIESHPSFESIGLIVPVSIYGKNVDLKKWEKFSKDYNIPIVIDAAASFDTISSEYLSNLDLCTICISLHATKVIGTGEGGLILFSKKKGKEEYIRAINFGFYDSRESKGYSINGKMSEYHAAIGLAALDSWPKKYKSLKEITFLYKYYAHKLDLTNSILCGGEISMAYCLCKSDRFSASIITTKAQELGIECRQWYGNGLHNQPQYKHIERGQLINTEILADKLIGIPMHNFLVKQDINEIITSLSGLFNY